MSKRPQNLLSILLILSVLSLSSFLAVPCPAAPPKPVVREIFVPYDDLPLLLDGQPERVFLTRQQYEELLAKAKTTPETKAPREFAVLSAAYEGTVEDERIKLAAEIVVDVLRTGLHAVPLEFGGVGVRQAQLDGQPAALGQEGGHVVAFVGGVGQHKLTLEIVAPLQTSAAQQTLDVVLPQAVTSRWKLTVPGNVELKSGASVIRRAVDADAAVTRFELLAPRGRTTLVMSLNNRLLRRNRVVVARSVLVDEVTAAYERLHATVSLTVLHGAADRVRFALPAGFEPLGVTGPLVAKWAVLPEKVLPEKPDAPNGPFVLDVQLREAATDAFVLNISALRTPARLTDWTLPQLTPLDVAGNFAVVGLLVEDRLQAEALDATGLIRIDAATLEKAIPDSLLRFEPGLPRLRPVAAYYAPQAEHRLAARFVTPPAKLKVTTNMLLSLNQVRQEVRGGFALLPEHEKLFSFSFTVPAGWHITEVTDENGNGLSFERYSDPPRITVRLPRGLPAGERASVNFQAVAEWKSPPGTSGTDPASFDLPVFAVQNTSSDVGAIAVEPQEDLVVRPVELTELTPLDDNEKAKFGLQNVPTTLAYRYERQPFAAKLAVTANQPVISAHALSFFVLQPDTLQAHYELTYDVQQARTRRLSLALPADTPAALRITGLDGTPVKEFVAAPVAEGLRVWHVELAEPRQGALKLAVDFEQRRTGDKGSGGQGDKSSPRLPLSPSPALPLSPSPALPLIRATDVAYQSGAVSVEGSAELDVTVTTTARKLDVGELATANYQVGRRLLGVFGYSGTPPVVQAATLRRPAYGLPAAIVQRGELFTAIATSGLSQTAARFQLRTKSPFLEVRLPAGATLWSASLDGKGLAPQRDGDAVLVSLTGVVYRPAEGAGSGAREPSPAAGAYGLAVNEGRIGGSDLRDLQIVYEQPIRAATWLRQAIHLPAPRLVLRTDDGQSGFEVPLADLEWKLQVPEGYLVTGSTGSVFTRQIAARALPPTRVAGMFAAVAREVATIPLLPQTQYAVASKLALSERATADLYSYDMPIAPMAGPGVSGSIAGGMGGGAGFMIAPAAEESMPVPTAEAPRGMMMAGEPRAPAKPAPGGAPAGRPELKTAEMPPRADKPGEGKAREELARLDTVREKHLKELESKTEDSQVWDDNGRLGDRKSGQDAAKPTDDLKGKKFATQVWALEGLRSLPIQIQTTGTQLAFQSLGVDPRLEASMIDQRRLRPLTIGLVLFVAFTGLRLTNRPARTKVRYVIAVGLVASLLPLVTGMAHELGDVCDGALLVACLLVPYYLFVAFVRWFASFLERRGPGIGRRLLQPIRWPWRRKPAAPTNNAPTAPPSTATTVLLLALLSIVPALAFAQAPVEGLDQLLPLLKELGTPVKLPDDAVVIPYEPGENLGQSVKAAEKVLVPHAKYVELWNRAYPDPKSTAVKPPADYAFAGAEYRATLSGTEFLLLTGRVDMEVLVDKTVLVPLPLSGGVLADARLDDQPARLRYVQVATPPNPPGPNPPGAKPPAKPSGKAMNPEPNPVGPPLATLFVAGKGKHRLDLTIRLKLERSGGWRIVDGVVPAAPATALTLAVPEARTEVRLAHVPDRANYDTTRNDETLATALAPSGELGVRWRPQVAEAEVERGLTADSVGVFDVREDGLRLWWQLTLNFRRHQRESFTLHVPGDYLVEKVVGNNVRGWQTEAAEAKPGEKPGPQKVEVTLLKAAIERETFTLLLSRRGAIGPEPVELTTPVVTVADAMLQQGALTIRRSPLLDLRTLELRGLARTNLTGGGVDAASAAAEESPLGIRPYQAFRFVMVPFAGRLSAAPVQADVAAETRSILKVAERETSLESRVDLTVGERPIHALRLRVPRELDVQRLVAPGRFEWSSTDSPEGQVLTVILAEGQQGTFSVVVRGTLRRAMQAVRGTGQSVAAPRIEVLGARRQSGDLVIQADPSYDVRLEQLKGCDTAPLPRAFGWLQESQRALSHGRVLHHDTAEWSATVQVVPRTPTVNAVTVTNVRVTERAIQETILIELQIKDAGIREVVFRLPAAFAQARITAPLIRETKIEPLAGADAGRVRVRLELQDEVMGQYRVVVAHDRMLTADAQSAAIPVVETGKTDNRYVAIQSAGRDEVVVDPPVGLDALNRQQQQWQSLTGAIAQLLSGGITQAFVVHGAEEPKLTFRAKPRAVVETAGARINFAKALLSVDGAGGYRGQQTYKIENRTEQYLEVELPDGATLWTARVAEDPVKPAEVAGSRRLVRIPLVKTAQGDADYDVTLIYGGTLTVGLASGTRFPLVRAKNIAVDLSQVTLYLPETHRWFDFGGTMRRERESGNLAAGEVSYLNKQLAKVQMDFGSEDEFVRARAENNLKQVELAIQSHRAANSSVRNDYLQQNYAANSLLLGELQKKLVESSEGDATIVLDNRDRIQSLAQSQEATRSKNVVTQLDSNFDLGTQPTTKPQSGPQANFNEAWFRQNGLANPRGDEARTSRFVAPPTGGKSSGGQGQPFAPEFANKRVQQQIQDQQALNMPAQRSGQLSANNDVDQANQGKAVEQYRRRLAEQSERLQAAQQLNRQLDFAPNPNAAPNQPALGLPPAVQAAQPGMPATAVPADPAAAVPPTNAPMPTTPVPQSSVTFEALDDSLSTSIASLSVSIPERGTAFYFTTPRGDVEVTARAITAPTWHRLTRLLGALAAAAVLIVGTRRWA